MEIYIPTDPASDPERRFNQLKNNTGECEMQKTKINKFIQKYNLGGTVNSVKWNTNDKKLSTTFVTPDKSLLGNVSVDNVLFENMDIGIYQTDQLQKLLNVLTDDVNFGITKIGDRAISLKAKSDFTSVDYVLSDLSIIPDAPSLKHVPEFGTSIEVDTKFIDTFIKGKNALSDVDTFTVKKNSNGEVEIIIGYSSTNTNRVNISVKTTKCDVETPISFNANLFKEVLVANRECTSAVLEVSNEGLARINFKVDDYNSTYYVVATQGVD